MHDDDARSRGALSRVVASCPIGVAECADAFRGVLPDELPDQPRLPQEIPDDPLQGDPVAIPGRRHSPGTLLACEQDIGSNEGEIIQPSCSRSVFTGLVRAQCCLFPRQWLCARVFCHVNLNNHVDVPRDSECAGQSAAVKLCSSSRVVDDHASRLVPHHRVNDISNSQLGIHSAPTKSFLKRLSEPSSQPSAQSSARLRLSLLAGISNDTPNPSSSESVSAHQARASFGSSFLVSGLVGILPGLAPCLLLMNSSST